MSVTHITMFQAKEGQGDTLHKLIKSLVPTVSFCEGFLSYKVLQNSERRTDIIVIEQWETALNHQAAAQQKPVHVVEKMRHLLVVPPTGSYYRA